MNKKIILLFLSAFVLRLLLINVAFHGDLNNNISWGNMALKGLSGFYERKGFQYSIPNQPPLYIFLFAATSFIFKFITNLSWYLNTKVGIFPSAFIWFWQGSGMIILVKLPSILADLGIGYVIYKLILPLRGKSFALRLLLLWLFNPITFYNSSIWGQTDPIVNLLGLISIYFLLNKKLVKSLLFLTLSLLFKESLAIFVPILVVYALLQKYQLKIWFRSIIYCLITITFISVWFHPNLNLPIWFFNLYTKQILPGEIGDLSANAFNFWYLINPAKVLDSVKYFGVAAHSIGYAISIVLTTVIILKLIKSKNQKTLFYSLALMALVSFLFMTRIHERYLYPFFPVSTILVGIIPDFIIPYLILSFTFLFNMYNLFWAPGIPILENILKTTKLPSILAIINLAILVFLFFLREA